MNMLLDPLREVKIAEGGQFDVVTDGWRMPCEVHGGPFRILKERRQVSRDTIVRLRLLGGFEEAPQRRSLASVPRRLSDSES